MTSIKTATVNVRIQENVKVEAKAILKKLGLTRATAIDLFYRQIIKVCILQARYLCYLTSGFILKITKIYLCK